MPGDVPSCPQHPLAGRAQGQSSNCSLATLGWLPQVHGDASHFLWAPHLLGPREPQQVWTRKLGAQAGHPSRGVRGGGAIDSGTC